MSGNLHYRDSPDRRACASNRFTWTVRRVTTGLTLIGRIRTTRRGPRVRAKTPPGDREEACESRRRSGERTDDVTRAGSVAAPRGDRVRNMQQRDREADRNGMATRGQEPERDANATSGPLGAGVTMTGHCPLCRPVVRNHVGWRARLPASPSRAGVGIGPTSVSGGQALLVRAFGLPATTRIYSPGIRQACPANQP